ncbi:MAG: peroxide stress protein YaaA [Marinilabiliales bacterium]|nr:MAG: peroxide stress protein YaaA [Marinilabiliales bacterium]
MIILSPAKTLNFEAQNQTKNYSSPIYISEANEIAKELKKFSPDDLQKLMSISPKLAELNAKRFLSWKTKPEISTTKQALLAFQGEVYNGMKAENFTASDLDYAQNNLRILSGMYGVLKPLDLIQAYRLEMGTKLSVSNKKNLYLFWQEKITDEILKELENSSLQCLINIASNEYYKTINKKKLTKPVITPVFKEERNGTYKVITIYAKKARGMMASFIIKNKLSNKEDIKAFSDEGYFYNSELSTTSEWVFTR